MFVPSVKARTFLSQSCTRIMNAVELLSSALSSCTSISHHLIRIHVSSTCGLEQTYLFIVRGTLVRSSYISKN